MNTFKDHFSSNSEQYHLYRPGYPDSLFKWLATITPETYLAWDCATGTGQAALQLAGYFDQVIASDASQQQINQATKHPNISYQVATENNPDIDAATVDLITVAQALHWFDLDIFFNEVRRVLKPGGILAVCSYNLLTITANIDQVINHLYHVILEGFWPEERHLIEEDYQSITLPFPNIDALSFHMNQHWDFTQLMGYLSTWSAVKAYENKNKINPLSDIASKLQEAWGEPTLQRQVTWPLNVMACKKQLQHPA
jgi:SAM-dependent methyltransferase